MVGKLLSLVALLIPFTGLLGCSEGGYIQATRLEIDRAHSHASQALTHLSTGNTALGQPELEQALALAPNNPLVLDVAGFYYEVMGGTDIANRYYLAALQEAPESGTIRNNYGIFLCRNGYYSQAMPYLLAAGTQKNYAQAPIAYANARYCNEQMQSVLGGKDEYAYYTKLLWKASAHPQKW